MIKLNYLDHVAIYVADLERSARWYEEVLGLKRYQFEEWGPYPIFMLSGKTGVAIFPAQEGQATLPPTNRGIRIEHFAFNVDQENFDKAREKYDRLKMKYTFQDHTFFHSIYTRDPDGHLVELTTIVVDEDQVYK